MNKSKWKSDIRKARKAVKKDPDTFAVNTPFLKALLDKHGMTIDFKALSVQMKSSHNELGPVKKNDLPPHKRNELPPVKKNELKKNEKKSDY